MMASCRADTPFGKLRAGSVRQKLAETMVLAPRCLEIDSKNNFILAATYFK